MYSLYAGRSKAVGFDIPFLFHCIFLCSRMRTIFFCDGVVLRVEARLNDFNI